MAAAPPSPNQVWNTWAASVLSKIGAPLSQTNYDTLWRWSAAESGSSPMRWNNPLNTTQPYPGATSMNSVGVKAYPSAAAGAQATANTLLNGYYPDLVQSLRSGIPTTQWSTKTQAQVSKWGTGLGFLHAIASAPTAAGRLPNQATGNGPDPFGIGAALGGFGAGLNRQLTGGAEVVLGAVLILAGIGILVLMAVKGAQPAVSQVAGLLPAGKAASAARAATAAPAASPAAPRSLSPQAQSAVAAARAGRGSRLSPQVRSELRGAA